MYRGAHSTNQDSENCGCVAESTESQLVVDATDCPENGRLVDSPACRAAVVDALADCDAVSVWTHTDETTRRYGDGGVALLVAAGRFAALVAVHDAALAARARNDPLGAAHAAIGRPEPIARIAAETGFAAGAHRVSGYDDALSSRPQPTPTTNATHVCRWELKGTMLHEVDDADELSPEELRARYDERLRTPIHDAGVEAAADESGVAEDAITALDAGESPELTVEEAASILAVREDTPDADTIRAELQDRLLMGMTTAVLDVEAVESGIDGALDAREIQQKIEGRLPMALDELALIHGYIEERRP